MPGVLLPEDEQNYPEDNNMQPSSFFESMFSPQVTHSQAQLMRNNSFSGSRDTSSLSNSAPIYHRSQSAISSSALQGFNHFFSPPAGSKKSDNGYSGAGSDVGDDMSNMSGDNDVLVGLSGASASSPLSMSSSSHREFQSDLRSFFDSGSPIVGSPTVPGPGNIPISKYLPSNDEEETWGGSVVDVYACDQFRMFEFKVRRCMRGRSHDWTECPFAHPGEKARRRDPRRFHYSGTACPDFRKGSCRRGDACEFAHGVFECWLHPARYRTQPCKDGRNCRRRVCFFAHTPEQLRLLPAAAQAASAAARNGGGFGLAAQLPQLSGSYDGSPVRSGVSFDGAYGFDASPAGCVSHCPPSPHGSCQNGSAHGGCGHFEASMGVNANVHNGHCCASPHMSSPTSTLVGHSPSPPPLSPPLSPSGSPPMSPQSPHHWPNSPGAQSISSSQSPLQVQAACMQASIQASMSHQLGYSQGPSSPLSRGSSSQQALSAAVAAAAHAHQTQSLTPPAHRRHLDRLNSMPTLSIPQVDHSHRGMLQNVSSPLSSPSSCSPPSPGVTSSASVNELIATIQSLNLRGNAIPLWVQPPQTQSTNQYSTGPSPLRRCSQSVPCTPTKLRWEDRIPRWEVDDSEEVEPPVQRVESGRDLRAKIYGRLGKENRVDAEDAPDLGWVNELVKDEQRPNGSW